MKRRHSEPIPKAAAIFLIVAGLLFGTLFTFGMNHWESPVTRAEAVCVNATFASFRTVDGKDVILQFDDHEQLTIDGTCANSEYLQKVGFIRPGSKLQLYVHPNSSTVLELIYNGIVIVDFDNAVRRLSTERSGFLVLGIFLYAAALYGAIKLIRKETD